MSGNLYTSAKSVVSAVKDIGRLREIVRVLARHGFGELVNRLGLTDTVGFKNWAHTKGTDDELISTAEHIRLAVEELGPTFIKLGQILSTRPDVVPAEIAEELTKLQDAVPSMSEQDVRSVLSIELGEDWESHFVDFDMTPLACASIAQVHRALLAKEGEQVVVKIQRPGITPRIERDLNILHVLARLVETRAPDLALMDPVGIVTEFDKALRKELDFTDERRNIGQFHTNFRNVEGVRVPRVFDRVSTSRVLVMEFISGVKVTEAVQAYDLEPYDLAPRMLRALFKMVFQDGLFHGDMHPGNIFVLEDSTVVLIDFGLVGRLTPRQRERILDILVGLSRQDYELVSRVMFDLGVKIPGVVYDYDAFEADVVDVMERHLAGRTLAEVDVGAYFGDLVEGAVRHQIKMPPTYTMVFKALVTVEGIGKKIAPNLSLIDEARPFIKEMMLERYDPKRLMREGLNSVEALSRAARTMPAQLTRLMSDLTEGRATLRLEHGGLDKDLATRRRIALRRNRLWVFSTLLFGGVIANSGDAFSFFGLSWLSWVLLVGAAAMLPWVLGAVFRE